MDTMGNSVILGHLEKTEARSVMNPNRNLFLYLNLTAGSKKYFLQMFMSGVLADIVKE